MIDIHTSGDGVGYTVLVVDDETVQRELCVQALQSEGFSTLSAGDGEGGLAQALDRQPDLILLDNRMPAMSGYEMLKRLRTKSDWGARVPVIFLSNIQPSDDAESADIEGTEPAHYLIKSSISVPDVVAKIKEVLGVGK